MNTTRLFSLLSKEWFLLASAATCLVFWQAGHRMFVNLSNPWWLTLVFVWLFAMVLGSAICVVRHADRLAERLGEPYGTLILTLSVTSIEVMSISAVMMHGANNPTLARDTLFAVTMIILNGMVGLSLLLGGWRYQEQQYNLQGANAYLGVIIPLAVLALVLPSFTLSTEGPTLSRAQQSFLTVLSVGLYVAFLGLQTHRHRAYFMSGDETPAPVHGRAPRHRGQLWWHAVLLGAYMAPVVILAEKLARPVDYVIETLQAPMALGGVAIAVLVATPEAIGAVRAAASNHLQRSINIFLGSVLSTIGLTVPAIIIISRLTDHPIVLGLQHTDLLLFLLTLAVCMVTFSSGRTNVLQGAVHLILFIAYVFLMIEI
jgi:Ca2+:H+ antiporter